MFLAVPMLLVLALPVALLVARFARRTPAPGPRTRRLRDVEAITRRCRRVGGALGALAAGATLLGAARQHGPAGPEIVLALQLAALGIVAGTVAGELRVAPPRGTVRTAGLEVRSARAYAPRFLTAGLVVCSAGFAGLGGYAWAHAAPDDLGRPGRLLLRACVLDGTRFVQSSGPWPGPWFSLPTGLLVGTGLAAAAAALVLVVRRPRQGEDRVVDDALRRRAAEVVVAATGLVVLAPLGAAALLMALALRSGSCATRADTVLGLGLLLAELPLVALGVGCLAALLRRRRAPSSAAPTPDAVAA